MDVMIFTDPGDSLAITILLADNLAFARRSVLAVGIRFAVTENVLGTGKTSSLSVCSYQNYASS
jgi:hypothetical protein